GMALIPFRFGAGGPPAAGRTLAATSSNPALLLDTGLVFGGSGSNRTVMVTPVPDQSGVATVTVTVRDSGGLTSSDSFMLTVVAQNDPPTISAVPPQTVDEDTPLSLALALADKESSAGSLSLVVSSSDTNLVPAANVTLSAPGSIRVLTILPATNRSGSATITLVLSDPN